MTSEVIGLLHRLNQFLKVSINIHGVRVIPSVDPVIAKGNKNVAFIVPNKRIGHCTKFDCVLLVNGTNIKVSVSINENYFSITKVFILIKINF